MTGYPTPPSISDYISQYSPLGGMLYNFFGPTLEGIAKEKLGIDPATMLFSPQATLNQRVLNVFGQADASVTHSYVRDAQKKYEAKAGNSIGGTLLNLIAAKHLKAEEVDPLLQRTLLSAGVRHSWSKDGGTLLQKYEASFGKTATPLVPREKDISTLFSDAVSSDVVGTTLGERAELVSNFIKSNHHMVAGYAQERAAAEWKINSQINSVLGGNRNNLTFDYKTKRYGLSRDTTQDIQKLVAEINGTITDKGDLDIKKDGSISYNGNNEKTKELVSKLSKLSKDSEFMSFDKDASGQLKADLNHTVEHLTKTSKLVKQYSKSIKSWADALDTSVEAASAQLNNTIGMDYAATFTGNHDVIGRIGRESQHINALTGKGAAFTQTNVHAAAALLKQMGQDTASAFVIGRQAALMHNPFASRYRVNGEHLDMFNIRMATGLQTAETSKQYAAMFAGAGFENTEEGRKAFWDAVKTEGITNENLNAETALKFINQRRKQKGLDLMSHEDFLFAKESDRANDFIAVDKEAYARNNESTQRAMDAEFLDSVSNQNTREALSNVLSDSTKRARFYKALTLRDEDANKELQALGITTMTKADIQGTFQRAAKTNVGGALWSLTGGNADAEALRYTWHQAQGNSVIQNEVEQRAKAEELLRDTAGETMEDKIINFIQEPNSANMLNKESITTLATAVFGGTLTDQDIIRSALDYGTTSAPTEEMKSEIRAKNLKRLVENKKARGAALEANNLDQDAIIASAQQEIKTLKDSAKDNKLEKADRERLSKVLSAARGVDIEISETGEEVFKDFRDVAQTNAADQKILETYNKQRPTAGISKKAYDAITIQDNTNIVENGTAEEQTLLAARHAAIKKYEAARKEWGKAGYKSDKSTEDIRGRVTEARLEAAQLGVDISGDPKKDVRYKASINSKYLEKAREYQAKNPNEVQSSLDSLGVKQLSGVEGLVKRVVELLERIINKNK